MKSINWVVNGVLAIAVIVLYVLHFNSANIPIKSAALNGAGTKVAYFEIDSIQNSYAFFQEVKSALQVKDMENAKQLAGLKNAFAAKYQALQKNGRYLSQAEVANSQQELAQLEKIIPIRNNNYHKSCKRKVLKDYKKLKKN